ncbi:MAG: NRT1/PTR family MFS transporter [Ruminococcaceae bacterium]|nr:NRT1/PTR family MFS transporter [Oscillospiraceae bacterium]
MKAEEPMTRASRELDTVLKNRELAEERRFFGYLYRLFSQNSLLSYFKRALEWIRRFRLAAFLINAFTVLSSLLQTGAALILGTVLFLIALPLCVCLMLGILLTALLESRRSNRLLLDKTKNKRIYVLFLKEHAGDFFSANARELATREGCAVVVVSPYWIRSEGICKGYFYCTQREEAKDLYLIRRYYFFSLRKHVLKKRSTAYLF